MFAVSSAVIVAQQIASDYKALPFWPRRGAPVFRQAIAHYAVLRSATVRGNPAVFREVTAMGQDGRWLFFS